MKVLVVDDVSKSFDVSLGINNVLQNCSLSLNEGTIFGLIGLNGIGKTTLIKIILDMLDADSGKVSFFKQSNKDYNSRKFVCYLPEKFQPSQYLTGYDFLDISLSFFKKRLDKKRAQQISEKIDLDPNVLNIQTGKYSKGMGQKLGLVGSLLSDAKLLILDEPMSGLDPKSRIMLKETLLEYKKLGNSIFFSSHILEDINEICDTVGILHGGNLKFRGTPQEMRIKYNAENPEKAFLNCINQY